jgi:DNA repair exonuclease SbcCD ATPase subunit
MSSEKKENLFKTSITQEFDALMQQFVQSANQHASNELNLQHELFVDQPVSTEKLHALTKRAVRAALPELLDIKLIKGFLKKLNGSIPCNSFEFQRRLAHSPVRSPEEDMVFLLLYGAKHGLKNRDFNAIPIHAIGFNFNSDSALETTKLASFNMIMPIEAERTYLFSGGASQRIGDSHFQRVADTGETIQQGAGLAHEAIELLKELFACFRDLFKTIRDALFGGDKDDIEEAIDNTKDAIDDLKDDIEDLDEDIEDIDEDIEEEEDDEDKAELREERREKRRERRVKKRALDSLEEALESLEDAQRTLKD